MQPTEAKQLILKTWIQYVAASVWRERRLHADCFLVDEDMDLKYYFHPHLLVTWDLTGLRSDLAISCSEMWDLVSNN